VALQALVGVCLSTPTVTTSLVLFSPSTPDSYILTLELAVRGFSNHPDGSSPFTGNVFDGECIGTLNGVVAVFIV
jgi:hypothetical protein